MMMTFLLVMVRLVLRMVRVIGWVMVRVVRTIRVRTVKVRTVRVRTVRVRAVRVRSLGQARSDVGSRECCLVLERISAVRGHGYRRLRFVKCDDMIE
jgi:hypothetical protein